MIRFNDCHIQFTDDDLFSLELIEQAGDIYKIGHNHGEGVGVIETLNDEESKELFDKNMKSAKNVDTAPFHRHTIISAPPGKTISGKYLAKAVEESKKTGEPIGRIMARLIPNAGVKTIITPSEAVPEKIKRSGKK